MRFNNTQDYLTVLTAQFGTMNLRPVAMAKMVYPLRHPENSENNPNKMFPRTSLFHHHSNAEYVNWFLIGSNVQLL